MIRVALLLACLAAAPAAADPAASKRAAEAAVAAATAGDFKTAAVKFTEAYQEDPTDSDAFCNIGISYFKVGEAARAHLLLAQCLDRAALELEFKDKARAVLVSIEEQLRAGGHTPVTVRLSPPNAFVTVVAFGPESQFSGARTLWLPFGTHQVEVRADGYVTETLPVTATDQKPTTVELAIKPTPVVVPPPPPPKTKLPAWPAIATTALVVGAGVFAVIARGKAHDAADRAPFAIDQAAADGVADDVDSWNLRFGIATGVAVAAAGVSGYLWYRALHTPNTRVEVTPTSGGAAATLTRRF